MTRYMVLWSAVTFALLGCTVGEVPPIGGGPDGGGNADKNICVPRVVTPPIAHEHVLEGANPAGPRSGLGCLALGCHLTGNTGVGATPFAMAGTVYKEMVGTTITGGVTIRLFPRGGTSSLTTAVTDSAGNFIIRANGGNAFDAFPYETDVSACGTAPEILPMIATIASPGEANCSASAACHLVPGPRAIYIQD